MGASISLRTLSSIFKSTHRKLFSLNRTDIVKAIQTLSRMNTAARSSFWGNRFSSVLEAESV